MVQSKSDKERQKLVNDKCQSLIEVLLKDEDNKYCVDCDAKGPRWASWNLGIFLCIRCAGIHRNLGVHISKVKSVNLDSWGPEHVAYMQRMGNSKARAIYEANLPDDFRRPQTDTALETFVRAKYEQKKYLAPGWVDPGPPAPAFDVEEEFKRLKEQKRNRNKLHHTQLTPQPQAPPPTPQQPPSSNNSNNSNSNAANNAHSLTNDLFDALCDEQPSQTPNKLSEQQQPHLLSTSTSADLADLAVLDQFDNLTTSTATSQSPIQLPKSNADILAHTFEGLTSIGGIGVDVGASAGIGAGVSAVAGAGASSSDKKILTKESIMSLYSLPSTATSHAPSPFADPFGMRQK